MVNLVVVEVAAVVEAPAVVLVEVVSLSLLAALEEVLAAALVLVAVVVFVTGVVLAATVVLVLAVVLIVVVVAAVVVAAGPGTVAVVVAGLAAVTDATYRSHGSAIGAAASAWTPSNKVVLAPSGLAPSIYFPERTPHPKGE